MNKLIQFLFVTFLFSTVVFAGEIPPSSLDKYYNTTWEFKEDDIVLLTVKFDNMGAEIYGTDYTLKAEKLEYTLRSVAPDKTDKNKPKILFYENGKDKTHKFVLWISDESCLLIPYTSNPDDCLRVKK